MSSGKIKYNLIIDENYSSSTKFKNFWFSTSTNNVEIPTKLHIIKIKLEKAISTENFEEAVKYRDLIKKLTNNN